MNCQEWRIHGPHPLYGPNPVTGSEAATIVDHCKGVPNEDASLFRRGQVWHQMDPVTAEQKNHLAEALFAAYRGRDVLTHRPNPSARDCEEARAWGELANAMLGLHQATIPELQVLESESDFPPLEQEDGYERHYSEWVFTAGLEPALLDPDRQISSYVWHCDSRWSDGNQCGTSAKGSAYNEPDTIVCRRLRPVKSDSSRFPVPEDYRPHVESHQALWIRDDEGSQWVCTRRWPDRSQCQETITEDEIIGDAEVPMDGVPHTRALRTEVVMLPSGNTFSGIAGMAEEVRKGTVAIPDTRTEEEFRQMMPIPETRGHKARRFRINSEADMATDTTIPKQDCQRPDVEDNYLGVGKMPPPGDEGFTD